MPRTVTDSQVEEAKRVLRAEYYSSVKTWAEDLQDRIKRAAIGVDLSNPAGED